MVHLHMVRGGRWGAVSVVLIGFSSLRETKPFSFLKLHSSCLALGILGFESVSVRGRSYTNQERGRPDIRVVCSGYANKFNDITLFNRHGGFQWVSNSNSRILSRCLPPPLLRRIRCPLLPPLPPSHCPH